MSTNNSSFWGYYPTVLFQKNVILEIWPTSNMDYNSKLNAITRLVILLTFIGYIFTFSLKILVVGLVTILVIYLYYTIYYREGFTIANQPMVTTATQAQTAILGNPNPNPSILVNPETI